MEYVTRARHSIIPWRGRTSAVAKLQQKPYETVPAYIVRFREEAQMTYPQYPVTEVESQLLRDTSFEGYATTLSPSY